MRHMLLQRHPQIHQFAGPDYRTAFAVPVLLAIHWGIAWSVSQTNVLAVFLVALLLGQVVIHSAAALVHETAHRLIFSKRLPKLLFDLHLELILGSFGRQLTYQHEHISSHHPHIGDYERDYEHEDICGFVARRKYRSEYPGRQRFVTMMILILHALPLGFLLADRVVPIFYRSAVGQAAKDADRHIGATKPRRSERLMFISVSLLANAILFLLFGFWGWLYHNWSLSLFLGKCGISNLGQSLSEHDGDNLVNPTKSTYGWINRILFNTGYHNEHHTCPNVPWHRLPALKRIAPDLFNSENTKSYVQLWWEHVRYDFGPTRRNPLMSRDNAHRCPSES